MPTDGQSSLHTRVILLIDIWLEGAKQESKFSSSQWWPRANLNTFLWIFFSETPHPSNNTFVQLEFVKFALGMHFGVSHSVMKVNNTCMC